MDHEDLKRRTAGFAIAVTRFTKSLLSSPETFDVARQLRRAANGAASNYRSAGLGRSHAEFTARLGVVLEEADESQHWLEYLRDTNQKIDRDLLREAAELRNIFAKSYSTARSSADRRERRKPRG